MVLNGFWFDEKVEQLVLDLQAAHKATAGDFQKALKLLYPEHRQITCEQDFRDFVEAYTDYVDNQEALAHYGSNY